MIVTLTANPSLDRTITLADALQPGEVQSAEASREDAGGKGINVAGVIRAAGMAVRAVLPLAADDPFDAVLQATGLDAVRVPVTGHVRANLTIADAQGTTTKLNLPGATLSGPEQAALIAATVAASDGAAWLVLAGSLPPGAPDTFYVEVVRAVRDAHGASAPRIAVDTSGEALRAVVQQAMPDLIKPNEDELSELAGIDLDPAAGLAEDVLRIARHIVPERCAAALITLGAHGAVLVDGDGAWHGTPPPITVASTVGAGDSSLAGFLIGDTEGLPAPRRLERSIRYGAAAASLPGTQPPQPADLPTGPVSLTRLT
ncbi:1-phosphofructokinase family hexose kinase [Microbacterium thalassium]|uniref:1-phosphofructokinase n=1 Tax=Microbacterium thalassium TaxID=362649 RepID=A0A7X0KVF2_9MICO|nr:1-phosphofructokinase family hexose kinase [Microbacterium thalassium]MBB6392177.1 1-phosphofructokinase [Microbacterium thalassium]GLK23388.1 1-phosphofructokinase [Microbacterium thalassium]